MAKRFRIHEFNITLNQMDPWKVRITFFFYFFFLGEEEKWRNLYKRCTGLS